MPTSPAAKRAVWRSYSGVSTFEAMTGAPCFCGSGRTLERCHRMPRRQRRRHRRSLVALAEAHDISALFPRVRPRDEVVEAFAQRVALELDPGDQRVPAGRVEEGVALLDDSERRRIVDDWASRYPDRWSSLCAAVGDAALTERAVVASAVRGAISERRPVALGPVAMLEDGALSRSPCAALALVLVPPLVWSRDDAILVSAAAAKRSPQPFFDAAEELAGEHAEEWHVRRVQALAERLGAQLPIPGLPRASRTLGEGCRRVVADEAAAHGVAAVLLATYALPGR
jgi:hypothetical protein